MVYIIGGVPRSGKSIVRRKLLKTHKISGISLDVIVEMLHKAMPELDINTAIDRKILNIRMWPFIEALIQTRMKAHEDYVIEGEYFTPDKIAVFKDDPRCKICFMIYPSIPLEKKTKHIRDHAHPKDWHEKLSDEELRPYLQEFHERSHAYKGQCEARGIKFFDTSEDFKGTIDETVKWLVNRGS